MPEDDHPDMTRRKLLTRIGLAGATAYTAPALTHLGMAHASGGSGGGAGGAGTGGGGSGGGARNIWGNNRSRPDPRSNRRRVVQAAPTPPDLEIILALPAGVAVTPARDAGYTVLGEAPNNTIGGTLYRLGLPAGRSVEEGLDELTDLLPDALSDENHVYTPDDFLCDDDGCAAHEMIGWSGWPSIYAPRIGVIDTGINQDHPALAGQNLKVHQADLGGRAAAGRKHGTAIAAMLVGRLEYRVPGLLPNASLVAVEAFHRGYYGEQADIFSLAEAMDILLAADVSVINMSFSGPRNAVLEELITRAATRGVATVAAAGNDGPGAEPAYPAAFEKVLAVTAVDHAGRAYRQANHGHYINFAAPGVRVWVAASVSGGRLKSGTSYAAPFVTASLAVQRLRAPALPLEQTITEMSRCAKDLGEDGHDPVFGHGLVAAPGQCFGEEAEFFPASGE
ncbi:S8 family serine peptidase [Lutimaribacter sp. EGI FJ00015]|uniref:S8 family serine peptidase n=1 Tax=Lutimaribacter degradans TaxID=2945989 RepID=A0ACC5ZZ38_9RHOB|nr:S8 family serine peptidase [Lutimaribacter sp. EGI FJ00013]MCM2563633.1 S8 family serine peptidase [Lutimaribacter sp. EGI FJ00013]MCO0614831.1 S8 family serine peptidase [Lutimaribacter sp. EGI FJ00015]MCO0637485.1 S8 family serine peptidase [Lutimaribacter sp. EGI FJ00014]